MAADSVHLGGEFRPTHLLPLPASVEIPGDPPCVCHREELLKIHPRHSPTLPYLGLDPCFPEHLEDAERVIGALRDLTPMKESLSSSPTTFPFIQHWNTIQRRQTNGKTRAGKQLDGGPSLHTL